MSAEFLRQAAIEMRATVNGANPGLVSEPDFYLALAGWLDQHAAEHGKFGCGWITCEALQVARAYLGGDQ